MAFMTLVSFGKFGLSTKNCFSMYSNSTRMSTSAPILNHSFKDLTKGFATEDEIENYRPKTRTNQKRAKNVVRVKNVSIKKLAPPKTTLPVVKEASTPKVIQIFKSKIKIVVCKTDDLQNLIFVSYSHDLSNRLIVCYSNYGLNYRLLPVKCFYRN